MHTNVDRLLHGRVRRVSHVHDEVVFALVLPQSTRHDQRVALPRQQMSALLNARKTPVIDSPSLGGASYVDHSLVGALPMCQQLTAGAMPCGVCVCSIVAWVAHFARACFTCVNVRTLAPNPAGQHRSKVNADTVNVCSLPAALTDIQRTHVPPRAHSPWPLPSRSPRTSSYAEPFVELHQCTPRIEGPCV